MLPSPKSTRPCSSNQSIPDRTSTCISRGARNTRPSASTRHPSCTSVRTARGNWSAAMPSVWRPSAGLQLFRKPSSPRCSKASCSASRIPPYEHAALIVVNRRLLAGDERAVVIELDERIEILAAVCEIGWLPAYPDGRPRCDTLNRVSKLRRKRVRREARSRERFGEPRRSVFRHQHRSGAAKLHQPWKIRTTREPSHRQSGDDESAVEDEQRLAHRHPLGIPLEHAVDSKPGRTRRRHEQLEFPRRSVVHADRGERAIAAGGRRVRAPGSRDQRQHALLQWSFQVVVVRLWIHGGAGEIAPRTLAAAQQRQDFPVLEVRELIDLVGRERQRLRPRPFPVALAAAAQHAQLGAAARDRGGHIDQVDDLRLQPAHAMRRVASRIRRALNLAQEVLPGLSPVRCRRGWRALARSIRRR